MFGVTALEVFANLCPTALPEPWNVGSQVDGPSGRGQKFDEDGKTKNCGMNPEPIEILGPGLEGWPYLGPTWAKLVLVILQSHIPS